MQRQPISKHAYLIGAPGPWYNFLPGVVKDLENVKRFLMSPRGGAWLSSEITIISDADFIPARDLLRSHNEDYRLVYFSGHGFSSSDNHHWLSFQDVNVSDLELVHPFILKQTIICDACSDFQDLGSIGGIGQDDEQWVHADGANKVRELFNEWIDNSPNGIQIFHSVKPGYSAKDTPVGGIFTNNLLNAVKYKMTPMEDYSYATMDSLVEYLAHSNVSMNLSHLIPWRSYNHGSMRVPFGVCLPAASANEIERWPKVVLEQDVNWGEVLLTTIGVTVIVGLLGD